MSHRSFNGHPCSMDLPDESQPSNLHKKFFDPESNVNRLESGREKDFTILSHFSEEPQGGLALRRIIEVYLVL